MPPKVGTRPKARAQLQTGTLVNGDPGTSRLLSDLATTVQALPQRDRNVVIADLVVGANTINHGLGRPARGMTLTPTTADATFAYSMSASDAKQATVTVVGVPQTKCPMEFY